MLGRFFSICFEGTTKKNDILEVIFEKYHAQREGMYSAELLQHNSL